MVSEAGFNPSKNFEALAPSAYEVAEPNAPIYPKAAILAAVVFGISGGAGNKKISR